MSSIERRSQPAIRARTVSLLLMDWLPCWPSGVLEDRGALLEEGAHALGEVLAARAEHLVAVLDRHGGLQARRVDRQAEAFLGQPQAHRRGGQHLVEVGLHGG